MLRNLVLKVQNSQLTINGSRSFLFWKRSQKEPKECEFLRSNWFFGKLMIFTYSSSRLKTAHKGIERVLSPASKMVLSVLTIQIKKGLGCIEQKIGQNLETK